LKGSQKKTKKKSSFFIWGTYIDYTTLFLILFLFCFGLVIVYSSSYYKGNLSFGDGAHFFKKQALYGLLGIAAMLGISHIRYQKLKKFSILIMLAEMILLILVFLIGDDGNGSTRWLSFGPVSFQPSELAKMALIIYMAHVCTAKSKEMQTLIGTIKLFIFPAIMVVTIAIENLSTAIICFVIVVAIWFVATPKPQFLIPFGIVGVLAGAAGIFLVGYRGDRIDAWLHPETASNGYQTMQSLYAIGSGGLFGRGLGQSIQKMGFIPEAYNDMVFSVICEELGIVGALAVVAMFVVLIWRFRFIAEGAPDRFGGLIVTGVIAHIGVQVIINICVVTNLIPNTGVTLPFISYGGSSLIFLLMEMGLVLAVARQIRPHKE
jgi:cell division protein FtsW